MNGTSPRSATGDRVKQLRAFCHTARLESFTRAAEHLGSSQYSVSQQVRELEGELALMLFERSGPNIRLTRIGHELLHVARPVVMELDRLHEVFEERHRGFSSTPLAIAASTTCAVKVVPRYLKQFREEHADVRVTVRLGGGIAKIGWLRAHEVELSFGAMDVVPTDIEFRRLFTSRVVLITPVNHVFAESTALDLDSLASVPMVAHPPEHYTRALLDRMARHGGVRLDVVMEFPGWDNIIRHVEMGVGVAVVPEFALNESTRVERVALDRLFPPRKYGVYRRREGMLSLAARHFLKIVEPGFASGG